jgi:hypothetical protein
MVMHLNASNGHAYKYEGYIDAPGHAIDGAKIITTKYHPKKRANKPTEAATIEHQIEGHTTTFTSIKDLAEHYKLPIIQE